jgi:hypothetical protein
VLEHPWEGVLTYVYGSVIKTTIYRMWYKARGVYVTYACSRDGIHWEKPLFKAFTVDEPSVGPSVDLAGGGRELCTSVSQSLRVKSNVVRDFHMPSMIYDPADRTHP